MPWLPGVIGSVARFLAVMATVQTSDHRACARREARAPRGPVVGRGVGDGRAGRVFVMISSSPLERRASSSRARCLRGRAPPPVRLADVRRSGQQRAVANGRPAR